MRLHTLLEANVEPKGLDYIEKFIHEIGEDLEDSNPSINHGAFLTRLRKDIINNNDSKDSLAHQVAKLHELFLKFADQSH